MQELDYTREYEPAPAKSRDRQMPWLVSIALWICFFAGLAYVNEHYDSDIPARTAPITEPDYPSGGGMYGIG